MKYLVTGKAWKHHIAEDFTKEDNPSPTHPNGAGAGGTVFLNFAVMLKYLQEESTEYYLAELDLVDAELNFKYGTDTMADVTTAIQSPKGFMPVSDMTALMFNKPIKNQCYVLGDGEGNYFGGEIFMSRSVIVDYRPHAKEYSCKAEAEYELNAVNAATDLVLRALPAINKYKRTDR